ncbi:MAG: hypothetical protein AVDCRST_MAG05-3623, partial [uncultured Rubrobacteraceae bacterium]
GTHTHHAGVAGVVGSRRVPGDLFGDLGHREGSQGGPAPQAPGAANREPRQRPWRTLPPAGAREMRQKGLQEVRRRKPTAPWPVLVPVPSEEERRRSHERVRGQNPAGGSRQRVRNTRGTADSRV